MVNLLFYPDFPNQESLCDQLYRAVWHFSPMVQRIDRLIFSYSGSDFSEIDGEQYLTDASKYLSEDFDTHIATIAPNFCGKICVKEEAKQQHIEKINAVLVWNTKDALTAAKAQDIADKHSAEVVVIDPDAVQQETLEAIRFAYSLWDVEELNRLVEDSHVLFLRHVERWQGRVINAFGNGPSLEKIVTNNFDVGDGVAAVCNSTIADRAALSHLKPEMLFCGDPVQHCGVSKYAGEFRTALAEALSDPSRVLFTQLGYVPYFRSITGPECHDRIIGIGNDRRSAFNLDLSAEFITAATANIFTMLVLPVACTVSKDINVFGCDGMSFSASTKPWSHSNEDDYMGGMAVTHRVHPGFWRRNYEEEYWSYCRDLGELLNTAENAGHKVCVRTPSYVPALAKRYS